MKKKVGSRTLINGLLFLHLLSYFPGVAQEKQGNPCLPPMSTKERDQLNSPQEGTLLLNTSTGCINYFTKGKWQEYCDPAKQRPTVGTVIYDTIQDEFRMYTGERWIPLEKFTAQVSLMKEGNETPAKNTAPETPEPNGEIIAPAPAEDVIPDINDCSQPPDAAFAGRDQVDIEKVFLEGNSPKHGTGHWVVLKGDSAMIQDPSDPQTAFTGKQGITYTLRWEISTRCDTSYDDVLIRIRYPCSPEPSQAEAGIDRHNIEVCYLNATVPKSGKGSWSLIQGVGGRIHEPEIHNSLFTGNAGDTYVLRWTVRTKCGLTQDDVRITFKPPCKPDPTVADAGEDQLNMINCTLAGNKPEHGTGKWFIVGGEGGRIISPAMHNSVFEGIPGQTYWLKWVISNECGKTEDGVTITFRKICPAKFTDPRDGKEYAAIEIGNQCWMAENLDYQGTVYHCYEDLPGNCKDYGALYSWEAAMDYSVKESSRGACPEGWHVPSDEEWSTLLSVPGIDSKALRTDGNSGFNLIYGGTRYPNGRYFNKKEYAFYWSSSSNGEKAWNRYFHAESNEGEHFSTSVENGFSVRCVRDD